MPRPAGFGGGLARLLVASIAAALAAMLAALPGAGQPALPETSLPVETTVWLFGPAAEVRGLDWMGQGWVVGAEPLRHPAFAEGADAGTAEWPPASVPEAAAELRAAARGSGRIEIEARFSPDGEQAWTPWQALADTLAVPSAAQRFVQVRAVLSDADGASGLLEAVGLTFLVGDRPALAAAQQGVGNPTVRLWATREGLVGGRTANGRRILEKDRFVALPSRRVLAKDGGREYQVRLAYNGRTATAPVWDVGPWNTKDNYWDLPAEREVFKDLPRFVPQAWAAWNAGHNSGRDQFGRWVSFPASIDIADGTFLDDLGMRASDWVDVTFLWLNAPSPPPPATNPRVTMKPAPGTAGAAPSAPAAPPEPPPGQRWYFAEGSTRAPFQTWLLLQNPNPQPASVTLTYMLLDGSRKTQTVALKPTSRQSVFANQVVLDAEFSTQVDSDRPILAERAMYFRADGHASAGAQRPQTRWCFADGSTQDGNDTWLLVQNPGSQDAQVTVGFLAEGGGVVRHSFVVPAGSRRSLYANLVVPNLAFGGCLEADRPVVAERAVYLAGGGGSGGLISAAPSRTWYFAEGNTRPGMRTTFALANPTAEAASAEITYLVEGGEGRTRTVSVPPMGRVTVDAAEDVPGARFGAAISASRPILAERASRFGPGFAARHGGPGAPALARTWALAEGSSGPPFQEYVLLANPGAQPAAVEAEFMRDDGSVVRKTYRVPAAGRMTVDANAEVPNSAISVRLRADQPIVVERSMYWGDMAGGSSAVAVSLDP